MIISEVVLNLVSFRFNSFRAFALHSCTRHCRLRRCLVDSLFFLVDSATYEGMEGTGLVCLAIEAECLCCAAQHETEI